MSERTCAICGKPIEVAEMDCKSEETGMRTHLRCFEGMHEFINESTLVALLHSRHGISNSLAKSAYAAYERARERIHSGGGAMYIVSLTARDWHSSIKDNRPDFLSERGGN